MVRFVSGQYANVVRHGGMLGYVLDGDITAAIANVQANTGSRSVGAAFQLGGKLGVGRCGGIEKTTLISLTSEERRTRPDMA
jgi:hypothetical protein